MLRKIVILFSFFTVVSLSLVPTPVYAQQAWNSNCLIDGVASLRCLPDVFSNVVTAALEFVGSVAVILLIYAGMRYTTSGGDPKQTQHARQVATYAIIGLVIVLSSFAIIYFIGYLTGSTKCITNINGLANGGC